MLDIQFKMGKCKMGNRTKNCFFGITGSSWQGIPTRTTEQPGPSNFHTSISWPLGRSCIRGLWAVCAGAKILKDFPGLFLFLQILRGNWNLNKSQGAHSVVLAYVRDRTSLSPCCSIKPTFCFEIYPSISWLMFLFPRFYFKINTSSSVNSSYILTVHRYNMDLPTRVYD